MPVERPLPKGPRLPQWMRRPIATDQSYPDVSQLLDRLQLTDMGRRIITIVIGR